MAKKQDSLMPKLISLAKRRGFIFPSAEVYGGLNSFYDYGPLGVELKNNIKRAWWKEIVRKRNDVVGLDSAILTPRIVWEASGHLESFSDPLVECQKCHRRFRADQLEAKECPDCGGRLSEPREFNLLMKTHLGPVTDRQSEAYLRGETCQGIYLNFLNVLTAANQKLPFGIAQIGKAFRNEITPGNFIFRTREFEQMEMQYFSSSKEIGKHYNYWKEWTMDWYLKFINQPDKIRWRQHQPDELVHYAKEAWDVEYQLSLEKGDTWMEFAGVHNRGDWDLSRHAEYSGVDFRQLNEETGEKFIPWVAEVSMGVGRTLLLILADAYTEVPTRSGAEEAKHQSEVVLKIHPELAPIKLAVLPLSKKPELSKLALEIQKEFAPRYQTVFDQTGSIGKRYRRQDEIGTPYCLTVDFDSLNDRAVTVRDRDTMEQERIAIAELADYFQKKF